MTDIAFYHLQKSPLEAVLPKLLEKTLAAGKRALVLASSNERVEALAAHLWTYDPDAWLPHGTAQDGSPEEQPIWLTDRDDNPNGAAFLFLTDGADTGRIAALRALLRFVRRQRPSRGGGGARSMADAQGRRPRGHLLAADRTRRLGAEGLIAPANASQGRLHARRQSVVDRFSRPSRSSGQAKPAPMTPATAIGR